MAEKQTKHYLRNFDINEKLLSSIDNGIIILNEELQILYFNNWLELHTSYKEQELLEKSICDVFENINEKTLKRKIKTALRMDSPTFYTASTSRYLIPIKLNQLNITDFEHMRQDVSIIPFNTQKRLVALIITDQTNMTNTNMLLQANILKVKELNSELVKERDTIDQKVFLIKFNLSFEITNISKAYLTLLGFNKDELLGLDYFEYQKLYINEALKSKMLSHIKEQKVYTFEYICLKKTGEELILLNTLVPEYDTYAKHIGFIIFIENVTNSRKLILQQENLLSTSRSAAMGEMISMIAHQWRQPLSVINTIMASVRVKKDLDMIDEHTTDNAFKKIEETVTYLSQTIDDFKDYFKPNKTIKDISITQLMAKSTTFLLEEMKYLDIEYTQHIYDDIIITTYQNELVQCIINILKNSIDAFEDTSMEDKSIRVNLSTKKSHLVLSIIDNAGGIHEKIIKKIFDPYFSTKSKNGTGLGLYMTKTIIQEHLKGKITIISPANATEVIIELPYNIDNPKRRLHESNMPSLPKCK